MDERVNILRILAFCCFFLSVSSDSCSAGSEKDRIVCYAGKDVSEEACRNRSCCWAASSLSSTNSGAPFCFYPSNYSSYEMISKAETDFGLEIVLGKTGATFLPSDFVNLTVEIRFETVQRLRVRIYNSLEQQFQVPIEVPMVEKKPETTDYKVEIKENPFAILVKRSSNDQILFDSSVGPLIFAPQFLQISTRLSSPLLYGLGEHQQRFLLNTTNEWRNLTFWARDFPPVLETNLYGVHPFHINFEMDHDRASNIHGQFLLNSNALQVTVSPSPAITYTSIGGIIDLYIFTGPTYDQVIQQYWDIIGKPSMPPYWALGFHLSRYGYDNIETLKATIQRMEAAEFPYDAQWTDIDVMASFLDFTYDNENFNALPDLISSLHSEGKRYVNIIDPAISSTQPAGKYPAYDDGAKRKIFIKQYQSEDFLIGKVWPGQTVFPDFTNPEATEWWTDVLKDYHDKIPFDGLWIDMNEPSNFVDGSVNGCPETTFDNPPYVPDVLGGKLNSKTLCASAQHYNGTHYDLHNLYGYFEAEASNAAMKNITGKRVFVLSRSSFAGSGKFAAHWTGDNQATFDDLAYSIPAILSFNMFGITLTGADICGFGLDTTDELCTRWMQLGAFYPFMRNHNDIGQKDQDPASFPWSIQQIMKQALLTRYSLMPYWYTLHHLASVMSKPLIRPLFSEFLDDPNTYNIDSQFLVGPALLVSPVLDEGKTKVNAYFPSDDWFEFPSGVRVKNVGVVTELDAPLQKINVHIRAGFIIPMQTAGPNLIIGRTNPFTLIVAPSRDGNATGKLFWDDGETIDSLANGNHNYLEFSLENSKLSLNVPVRNYTEIPMRLDLVRVFAVSNVTQNVTVNGASHSNFLYNKIDEVLSIFGLNIDLLAEENQIIEWS